MRWLNDLIDDVIELLIDPEKTFGLALLLAAAAGVWYCVKIVEIGWDQGFGRNTEDE